MSVQRGQDLKKYINVYLEKAKSCNKTQGMNGTYFGYANENLDVVYNIIESKKISLDVELLRSIVDVGIETLKSEKQTILIRRLFLSSSFPKNSIISDFPQRNMWINISYPSIIE